MLNMAVNTDLAGIQTLFHDYVERTGSAPRHTKEARIAAGNFEAFLHGAADVSPALHRGFMSQVYDRMMDCAVEFEESGFIAGFRYALSLTKAHSTASTSETHSNSSESVQTPYGPVQGSQGVSEEQSTNNDQKADTDSSAEAVPADNDEDTPHFITTWDIAEMFETPHSKVVKRIENEILPHLDEERKSYFEMDIRYIRASNRRFRFYRLNRVACEEFLNLMEPRKKYVNIAAGITKLKLMVEQVFPMKKAS